MRGHGPARGAALIVLLGSATPATAEGCRLALVLALDVSSSVNAHEDQMQRLGLAHALVEPRVARAFLGGEPVALFVFEWSGPDQQHDMLPGWEMIESEQDLVRVAGGIAKSLRAQAPRSGAHLPDRHPPSTALGAALGYAALALTRGPDCQAQVIDVSGDGESNDGLSPATAFEVFPLEGVTVNALVVGGALDSRGEPANDLDLVAYFEAEVLHGPGAFCVLADGYEDYARAMRVKLVRELQEPMVGGWIVADGGA